MTQQRRKKWKWAQRVANQPSDRWSKLALQWQPDLNIAQRGQRAPGHPRKRWSDDITEFLAAVHVEGAKEWTAWALDQNFWSMMETSFATREIMPTQHEHPAMA